MTAGAISDSGSRFARPLRSSTTALVLPALPLRLPSDELDVLDGVRARRVSPGSWSWYGSDAEGDEEWKLKFGDRKSVV